jgi:hypothetical protein
LFVIATIGISSRNSQEKSSKLLDINRHRVDFE